MNTVALLFALFVVSFLVLAFGPLFKRVLSRIALAAVALCLLPPDPVRAGETYPDPAWFKASVTISGPLSAKGPSDLRGTATVERLVVTNGALVAGKMDVSGAITTAVLSVTGGSTLGDTNGTDRVDVYALLTLQGAALTLTNAHYITPTRPRLVLTTLVASNAVTLAPATYEGQVLLIECSSSLTNIITILDSGTALLSATFNMNTNDTLLLVANAASNWVERGRSAN